MPDFTDLISQAKKMQEKMKETQEALKNIEVEGVSGGNAVKVIMNGDGELKKINLSETLFKEWYPDSWENVWAQWHQIKKNPDGSFQSADEIITEFDIGLSEFSPFNYGECINGFSGSEKDCCEYFSCSWNGETCEWSSDSCLESDYYCSNDINGTYNVVAKNNVTLNSIIKGKNTSIKDGEWVYKTGNLSWVKLNNEIDNLTKTSMANYKSWSKSL